MDFPFGRHGHHHHRKDDDEDNYPPPARGDYTEYNPPPPNVTHVHHASHSVEDEGPYPPPPRPSHHGDYSNSPGYPRPPPSDYPSSVTHFSHEDDSHENRFRPHKPSFIEHITHHNDGPRFSDKPTVRVYCKAAPDFSLSIRDGKVILAPSDPSDPFQHWIKDEKYSTKVKDQDGYPAFSLVNKATGEAMKHSIGGTQPVQLIPYNPDHLDESILWTLSTDTGEGYRAMRMVNNIRLNVDAFNGDKDHGGVRDGTIIVLWEWATGENQRWMITRY